MIFSNRIVTKSDLEYFLKNCTRHIKKFAIEEKNAQIYIIIEFNFWYGLFFGRKTKNWIMNLIDEYKPIGCLVTLTLQNRLTL